MRGRGRRRGCARSNRPGVVSCCCWAWFIGRMDMNGWERGIPSRHKPHTHAPDQSTPSTCPRETAKTTPRRTSTRQCDTPSYAPQTFVSGTTSSTHNTFHSHPNDNMGKLTSQAHPSDTSSPLPNNTALGSPSPRPCVAWADVGCVGQSQRRFRLRAWFFADGLYFRGQGSWRRKLW